ncbi:low molecular weight protein-tyrosine-phosphatase [Roseivirga sp.]|uniref:low molecular weight protein-tyrosine-phosphatase n=1 Tax=Roseivirga sp. TaxID=1964215 RepID=UPI003B8C7BED
MNKVKILFVCLGNICRSPLAEGILRQRVEERGIAHLFEIDSCGTAAYHIGKSPDQRSVANALKNGVSYQHAARQLNEDDFDNFDFVIPMDDSNYIDAMSLVPQGAKAKVIKMRAFDDLAKGSDVPDPYYGGENGFQEVFEILDRSVNNFLDHLGKLSEN